MYKLILGVVVIAKLMLGYYMTVYAVDDIQGLMVWRGLFCLSAILTVLFVIWLVPDLVSVSVALLATAFVSLSVFVPKGWTLLLNAEGIQFVVNRVTAYMKKVKNKHV